MTKADLSKYFSLENPKKPIQVTKCALFVDSKFHSFIDDIFYFNYNVKVLSFSITNEDFYRKVPLSNSSTSCYMKLKIPFIDDGPNNYRIFGLHSITEKLIIFDKIYIDYSFYDTDTIYSYLKFSAKII